MGIPFKAKAVPQCNRMLTEEKVLAGLEEPFLSFWRNVRLKMIRAAIAPRLGVARSGGRPEVRLAHDSYNAAERRIFSCSEEILPPLAAERLPC